ncbi:hypothetical protein NHQ30_011203 [Ciborinia camelliae]|nr:hypothetical protein NHQ30_011203 [Ciborinia camelliae]
MALSTFAAEGLKMVEAGSYILYGAGYFTREEWVKLDPLLHKGRYVFTESPQSSPPASMDPWELGESPITRNEKMPQPESQAEELLLVFDESPEDNSGEATVSITSIDTKNDMDEDNSVVETDITPPNFQHEGFPTSSSQERECNTFASSVNENICMEDEVTNMGEPVYIEQEQNSEEFKRPVCPVTNRKSASVQKTLSQPLRVQSNMRLLDHEKKRRIKMFTQNFGRAPNEESDYWQPKNPEFRPKWLGESSSNSVSILSAPNGPKSMLPRHSFTSRIATKSNPSAYLDKWFIATREFSPGASKSVKLEIARGDSIYVTNHVSGNEYRGQNGRTGKSGHFNIALISQEVETTSKKVGGFSMDEFEKAQTAEWEDDDDDFKQAMPKSQSTSSNDEAGQSGSESSELESTASNEKSGQKEDSVGWKMLTESMADNKELRISKSRADKSRNSSPKPEDTMPRSKTRERLRNEPYEIVVPKTEVCYHWASKNDCRYTEAQCRDLHEDREYTLQTNIRNGKPNPGPLWDVVHAIPPPPPGKSHTPPQNPSTTVGKRFTCFFWHGLKCLNSEADCAFLHTNRNRPLIAKPKLIDTDKTSAADEWGATDSTPEKCSSANGKKKTKLASRAVESL